MNDKKEITLRDFIDLLHIPAGLKKSPANLSLYTIKGDYICSTQASSIGINPYLDMKVISLKAINGKIGISYDITLGTGNDE